MKYITYDANGNRASKTTPFGTIRYWYDAENKLVHSGSDEGRGSDYTYDKNGNLLTKTNLYKTEEYSYTGTNRMSMSTVTDHIKKTKTITHYDYDAFGRRTLVQDEGGKIIRTLYDGLSFDIIREQETFADGCFTNTSDTGIAWRPVSEGDGSRYRYIGDDAPAPQTQEGYSVTATNRASSRVALYANGQAVGVTRSSNYASSERNYFGTDLMGTVRSATTDSGSAEYYEYDVFGKPYGESVSDYAYTGKPYDPVTGMYNYGYRDYVPQTARFTTIDPIRDGSNWFAYCNNEPVNFLDLWGLEDASTITLPSDSLKTDTPVYFKQGDFADVLGAAFAAEACAATSLLNELSEQYTKNTGKQMTPEQAKKAMQAAVDSGKVRETDAYVKDWEAAANDMWKSTGQTGNYTYGGSEATVIIYAEDKNKNGEPDHFTNSNGIDSNGFPTYHDPSNGETGIVGDTPLQSPKIGWGSTRELTYHPECTND